MVAAKRIYESRTTARYERWLRAAEASGDMERILDIEDALAKFPQGPATSGGWAGRSCR